MLLKVSVESSTPGGRWVCEIDYDNFVEMMRNIPFNQSVTVERIN